MLISLRLSATSLDNELKVEDMEFDAIVNSVKSGKADFGAAGMTVTEDRKKSVDFTDPYTTAEQVVIVKEIILHREIRRILNG